LIHCQQVLLETETHMVVSATPI